MKRDLTAIMMGIILSVVLFVLVFLIVLKYTVWGQFNSLDASLRPDLGSALDSRGRVLMMYQFIVYPLIFMAVGVLVGCRATRPVIAAIISAAPARLFHFVHDGLSVKSWMSLIADLILCAASATLSGKLRKDGADNPQLR
jgi:hypothetical protein